MSFIQSIKEYSALLGECSVWHNSREILAPVITDDNKELAADSYIYEFYCYISIVVDLKDNYEIRFVEGQGDYKYKFPQAAANKSGKPLFCAYQNETKKFQICAGTKIRGLVDSEENHPDISFQLPDASGDPTHEDLIIIMDAKFKENGDPLPKAEVYKFGIIVDLFDLKGSPKSEVLFSKYKGFESNCLLTNGEAYSDTSNVQLLNRYFIKEIEKFYPNGTFRIIG